MMNDDVMMMTCFCLSCCILLCTCYLKRKGSSKNQFLFWTFPSPVPVHNVITTLLRRCINVLRSFQHPYNVVLTSCSDWRCECRITKNSSILLFSVFCWLGFFTFSLHAILSEIQCALLIHTGKNNRQGLKLCINQLISIT